jgi:serine O-acetyltransferase
MIPESVREDLRMAGCKPTMAALAKKFLSDPSFCTVLYWRLACYFAGDNVAGALVSKLVWRFNTLRSGCFLSPRAILGNGILLPHATGIVVGEGVTIDNGVTIFQNVTIGRRDSGAPSYPHVGSGTIIYSGACLIGGIKIGRYTVIGANAVVTSSAAENSVLVGVPARPLIKSL